MTQPAIALDRTPVHLSSAPTATIIEGFNFDPESFQSYIAQYDPGPAVARLAMIEHSPTDWGMWECHAGGDELVVVIKGRARFFQELDGETVAVDAGPGDAVRNPAGVFHTADILEPMTALYLTPCRGTKHRPR